MVTLEDGKAADVEVVRAIGQIPDDADAEAVDMPIGLVDEPIREADQAAREALPGRASSVFNAPPRCVIDAVARAPDGEVLDHATASALARERTGKGLSRQSWALVPKIVELDGAVRAGRQLLEVHPELAFAAVAGEVLPRKRSWAGVAARWRVLADLSIDLPTRFEGDGCAPDDVLDAAICAWVADGAALGEPLLSYPAQVGAVPPAQVGAVPPAQVGAVPPAQVDATHPGRELSIVVRPLPSRSAGR